MPGLSLILGAAGSGKTQLMIERVCRRAMQAPLASEQHPPQLVIVPEQQALMTEQALLARLSELMGRPAATSRIRVMSLSRLGNWLCSQAGQQLRRDGDLGRRLLVWRILTETEQGPALRDTRQARVEQLSEVLAELRQFGTTPEQLRQRSAQLAGQPAASRSEEQLPQRLLELAELLERYQSGCEQRGLQFTAGVANIERLLSSRLWPLLEHTEVHIDGFAGFTPPEEQALLAILTRTSSVTACILLDPRRADAPLPTDSADWFAPGRELFETMLRLAAKAGVTPRIERLEDTPRWQPGNPLAQLSSEGAMPVSEPGHGAALHCVVCNDERTEVLEAVRIVRRLLRDDGLRASEISIIARDLEPYAELLAMRLPEHGIPAFIDRRMPLSYHPLLQLVRGLLRVAAGQAGNEELAGLLRCGLLPFAGRDITQREAVDRLLRYSTTHGLSVPRWLDEREWNWHRELATEENRGRRGRDADAVRAELAQLDSWRRELLAPARELRAAIEAEDASLGSLLDSLRGGLPAADDLRLTADEDRLVLERVGELLNEMELLGAELPLHGEQALELRTVVNWLEYGFGRLQQAMPPLRQEHLLVTEIERGRHHPVRASILLGLADGSWPAPAMESPWFSENQRRLINGNEKLLSEGGREDCMREPWLAMIALTRASQELHLLRPAADSEGRARPMSAWYRGLLQWSGGEERRVSHQESLKLSQVESEPDLVVSLALGGHADRMPASLTTQTQRALDWARDWMGLRRRTQRLDPAHVDARLRGAALSCSATRLENFAACPYKHYVRYWLRLDEEREPAFDALTLGNMYHAVFERTVTRLNAEGHDWLSSDWQAVSDASRAELEALRTELQRETARERVDYVLERASILLEQHARRIADWLAGNGGRVPLQTELRFGGSGAELPAYELVTPAGRIRLSGFIDRLDSTPEGLATVIDYKLGSRKQAWNRLLAGYQLQLFVYMLAIRGHSLSGSPALEPCDAEYQSVEVQWDASGHADFSATQVLRPSGRSAEAGGEEIRQRLHSWALQETQRVLKELGGRLLSGEVRAWPLRDRGSFTACNGCPARSICRFDPVAGDTYREMLPLGNREIQKELMEGEPDFTGSALGSSGEDGNA